MSKKRSGISIVAAVLIGAAGCNPATDRSPTVTQDDIQKFQQKQAASLDERTDLTPEQKENLRKYYGGGGTGGVQGGPPQQGTGTGQ